MNLLYKRTMTIHNVFFMQYEFYNLDDSCHNRQQLAPSLPRGSLNSDANRIQNSDACLQEEQNSDAKCCKMSARAPGTRMPIVSRTRMPRIVSRTCMPIVSRTRMPIVSRTRMHPALFTSLLAGASSRVQACRGSLSPQRSRMKKHVGERPQSWRKKHHHERSSARTP